MFSYLRGSLVEKGRDRAVVETAQGVAYELVIPEGERDGFPDSGSEIRVFTHLYVREDELTLYGFSSRSSRDFFRQLLPQQGIGPKLAMSILSEMGAERFRHAIYTQDLEELKEIRGIGTKTAQRLILELAEVLPEPPVDTETEVSGYYEEATQALVGLGFSKNEASEAVKQATDNGTFDSVEALIRDSLGRLEAEE